MAFLNYFDHSDRKKYRSHLKDLIRIALADGIIKDEERHFLEKVASKGGIEKEELQEIVDEIIHVEFVPPTELYQKFEHLYNITTMIMVDEDIHEKEIGYCLGFGHALNFSEELTTKLIDELQSNPQATVDELFEKLVKKS